MEQSLFEKYGGFAQVSRLVLQLYDRLIEDEEIGPFFDDVDLPRLVDHQTKFVSSLLGGPASFTDKQIELAHRHLDIGDEHFDRLLALIEETLVDFGFEPEDIDIVRGAFEVRRPLLTEKPHVD